MPNDILKNFPQGTSLYPFQKEAILKNIAFLLNGPEHACYNASEMGLGKTLMTIGSLNAIACKRILVVVPAIAKLVWKREIARWSVNSPRVFVLDSSSEVEKLKKETVAASVGPLWIVVSYSLCYREGVIDALKIGWDALVLDEAHNCKNGKAQCTKAVVTELFPRAQYRIALSGTPATRSIVDCYPLFHSMLPEAFPTFWNFANEFANCEIRYMFGRTIRDYYGVKNAETLSKLIRKYFYVRYTKKECLPELPDRQWNRLILDSSYAVKLKKEVSSKVAVEWYAAKKLLNAGKPVPVFEHLATVLKEQGIAKAGKVAEFVDSLAEEEVPVVLFAYHTEVLHMLRDELSKKYKVSYIDGSTSPKERAKAESDFQSEVTDIFIGQIQAAGVSITLTRSSTVVLAELYWTPAIIGQAVDRVHRISQKDMVNIHYFVVENSLDEEITDMLIERSKDFNSVLG